MNCDEDKHEEMAAAPDDLLLLGKYPASLQQGKNSGDDTVVQSSCHEMDDFGFAYR